MPPKISIDAKLEELHTFVSENIALFASRAGESVQRCLRQYDSKVDKYWQRFFVKRSGSFNDVQQRRLEDIYKLISSHRLAESVASHRLAGRPDCKCLGDASCRSGAHAGALCTSTAQTEVIFKGMCRACAPEQRLHCKCGGGEACRKQKHHAAGKCRAFAQTGDKFEGKCKACAAPPCGCKKCAFCEGTCKNLARSGIDARLCEQCAQQRQGPCDCRAAGLCAKYHDARYANNGCGSKGPCPNPAFLGGICDACQVRRMWRRTDAVPDDDEQGVDRDSSERTDALGILSEKVQYRSESMQKYTVQFLEEIVAGDGGWSGKFRIGLQDIVPTIIIMPDTHSARKSRFHPKNLSMISSLVFGRE